MVQWVCATSQSGGSWQASGMGYVAGRAEQIAGFLVAEIVGAEAIRQGPSSAMDFELRWPNGDLGVLEVTVVPHGEAIRWKDQLA